MTVRVRHSFTSQQPDRPAPRELQPSHWNADHVIEGLDSIALTDRTGTDADTAMVANSAYLADMTAWATADRNYTLPTTAAVGDRIKVEVLVGNASFELILKTGAGQTCAFAGSVIAAATEITRLFITGESMTFRYAATNKWIVEHDGRIAQVCVMRLSTSTSVNESAITWTSATAKSGVWTADVDNASLADTANDRIKVRRTGRYDLLAEAYLNAAITADKYIGVVLWKNGTSTLIGTRQLVAPALKTSGCQWAMELSPLSADDTVNYQYISEEGSKLLRGGAGYVSWFSVKEVF